MNGLLQALAVLAAIVGLWMRTTTIMETRGRGWFLRNWLGGTIACFIGVLVMLMLTADSELVNLLGFAIAVGAASAPWWPMPETTAAKAAIQNPAPPDNYKPKITHGDRLDVIRFDYVNQKGEFTSRRVMVQMVGEWQFEGIDLDKGAERTFRYESVMGNITSEKTGEALSPLLWRESIR